MRRIVWLIVAALTLLILWFMVSLNTPTKDPGITPPHNQIAPGS